MAERFYVNCLLRPGPVTVEGAEAHHLATVCRLRPGAAVCLFNGDGRQYPAVVAAVERKRVILEVQSVESPQRELPFPLEIGVPLPKGDRAQFLVEKLTELGATRLVPLRTSRSVVLPREGKWGKLERWVIEASKQCGRNTLMEIAPLTDWASYAGRADLPALRGLAHPGGKESPPLPQGGCDGVALAVGPEGGFTEEEVALAVAAGWRRVGLGPRTLRVETAAIVLAGVVGAAAGASPGS
jgi:16S rRNA (uracil1498-N3)-methyltransferase